MLQREHCCTIEYDGYLVHGSENSNDRDVLYYILDPKPFPSFQQCSEFCRTVKININHDDDEANSSSLVPNDNNHGREVVEENRNICLIKDGYIVQIYKGNEDEANNALLRTYPLHLKEQEYENPVKYSMERVCILKIIRTCRALLTWFTKNKHRGTIKKALRSHDFNEYLGVLKNVVDISNQEFYKLISNKDAIKSLAFQLGQTIALIRGIEVYTKNEISELFPELSDMLTRREFTTETFDILNKYKNELVAHLACVKSFKLTNTSWDIFFCDSNDPSFDDRLLLCQQLNGVVIDMKVGVEFCIFFPHIPRTPLNPNVLFAFYSVTEEHTNNKKIHYWMCKDYTKNNFENHFEVFVQTHSKQDLLDALREEIVKSVNYDLVFDISNGMRVIGKRHKLSHKTVTV
ncbi:hypothetical protein C9374_009718 [Naegleria lovaniensis]|uniref:Uncharacterized protein n=1 Tax=Naegleria lovaniensis TaxID=51637 RepID=A0AA88KRA3_NAELO|nr:uncharacterized protein C9374_009718 [Naegleria lovaniensis]KAG2393141.1 hypothetical protein C9374_009718 [Naegleria lovaniensis]